MHVFKWMFTQNTFLNETRILCQHVCMKHSGTLLQRIVRNSTRTWSDVTHMSRKDILLLIIEHIFKELHRGGIARWFFIKVFIYIKTYYNIYIHSIAISQNYSISKLPELFLFAEFPVLSLKTREVGLISFLMRIKNRGF